MLTGVTVKKKPERYVPFKMRESTHKNLLRLQALRTLQNDGVKPKLNDLLDELMDSQPTIEITGKEIVRRHLPP